jgi:hypothetical protein
MNVVWFIVLFTFPLSPFNPPKIEGNILTL